jgi:GxxExxY protein
MEERVKPGSDIEKIAATVVDVAFHLHRDVGPGLLESVYEALLARLLEERGLTVDRQKVVPVVFRGLVIDEGFRADLVVDHVLVVELKSVERLADVHHKQLLTYLKLMQLPLGLLINFGAALFKDGIKRIAHGHQDFAASSLRVHRK